MSKHVTRIGTKVPRRGSICYYAACACDWRGVPWDNKANPERERIAHEIRVAQAEYVQAWRAKHPQDVRRTFWDCPLCGKAMQIFIVGIDPNKPLGPGSMLAKAHQDAHGQDWLDYMAAGQGAERGEVGG